MPAENTKVEGPIYDLAVVGCGPAGLSAAVNARIRDKNLILLGGEFCSPKLERAPAVENYLGLPGVAGNELRDCFLEHTGEMGINPTKARVEGIHRYNGTFQLLTRGRVYQARAVVLATGAAPSDYLPGEREFLGRGVSHCATCDGPLFRGKRVAVIGYTAEGEEEVRFLAGLAGKIYYLPVGYVGRGQLPPGVEVMEGKPRALTGGETLQRLEIDGKQVEVDGVFIIRGVTPVEELVEGLELEEGAVRVGRHMETNIPGLFAAGDCTGKPYQLAKAIGEGQVAAWSAVKYLDTLG